MRLRTKVVIASALALTSSKSAQKAVGKLFKQAQNAKPALLSNAGKVGSLFSGSTQTNAKVLAKKLQNGLEKMAKNYEPNTSDTNNPVDSKKQRLQKLARCANRKMNNILATVNSSEVNEVKQSAKRLISSIKNALRLLKTELASTPSTSSSQPPKPAAPPIPSTKVRPNSTPPSSPTASPVSKPSNEELTQNNMAAHKIAEGEPLLFSDENTPDALGMSAAKNSVATEDEPLLFSDENTPEALGMSAAENSDVTEDEPLLFGDENTPEALGMSAAENSNAPEDEPLLFGDENTPEALGMSAAENSDVPEDEPLLFGDESTPDALGMSAAKNSDVPEDEPLLFGDENTPDALGMSAAKNSVAAEDEPLLFSEESSPDALGMSAAGNSQQSNNSQNKAQSVISTLVQTSQQTSTSETLTNAERIGLSLQALQQSGAQLEPQTMLAHACVSVFIAGAEDYLETDALKSSPDTAGVMTQLDQFTNNEIGQIKAQLKSINPEILSTPMDSKAGASNTIEQEIDAWVADFNQSVEILHSANAPQPSQKTTVEHQNNLELTTESQEEIIEDFYDEESLNTPPTETLKQQIKREQQEEHNAFTRNIEKALRNNLDNQNSNNAEIESASLDPTDQFYP